MKFERGRIVWAKLGSYPYWPSKVVTLADAPKSSREQLSSHKNSEDQLVYFFGSRNYAWVTAALLQDYEEGYDEYSQVKTKQMKDAIKEANKFKQKNQSSDKHDNKSESDEEQQETDKKKKETKKGDTTKKKVVKKKDQNGKKSRNKGNDSEEEEEEKEEEEEEEYSHKEKETEKEKATSPKKRKMSEDRDKDNSLNGSQPKKPKETSANTISSPSFPKKLQDQKKQSQKGYSEIESAGESSVLQTPVDISSTSIFGSISEKDHHTLSTQDKMESTLSNVSLSSPSTNLDKDKDRESTNSPRLSKKKLGSNAVSGALSAITRHPISKYHKLQVVNYSEGTATIKASFSDARASSMHEVHFCLGSAYYLLDVACYVACLTSLHEGESAVTQDIHVTIMQPVPQGSDITVKATVQHMKDNLIFVDGSIWHNGRIVITGRIIKSTSEPVIVMAKDKEPQKKNNSPPL